MILKLLFAQQLLKMKIIDMSKEKFVNFILHMSQISGREIRKEIF